MPVTNIPPETVVILRSALLSELGVPAGELDEASMSHEKEKHPERFLKPLALLDAQRIVLDLLGWCEPDRQESIPLNVDAHRSVIIKAMRTRLEVERDYMNETNVKGARQQRETATRNARLIEAFLRASGLTDHQ
ncbi:MAG: hypothetical protein ACRDJ3_08590 [Solirubrobacteraceae bacterium]